MGTLDKQVFKSFVDSGCDRRLLLSVGRDDPRWLQPPHEITVQSLERRAVDIAALGRRYEDLVYKALVAGGDVVLQRAPNGEIVKVPLTGSALERRLSTLARPGGRLCLIEHEFTVPASFSEAVLGLDAGEEIPLLKPPGGMRPDLLLLQDEVPKGAEELLPGARTRPIPPDEKRTVLRIIDIKHTAELRVGRSHFIELLCYAHALSAFVHESNLADRILVPTLGHGILPQHEQGELFGLNLRKLDAIIVPLLWADVAHLFSLVQERLQALWRSAPLLIESTDVALQAACGHCPFVEDCKQRLGHREGSQPSDWDIRLLPHSTSALSQQLEKEGFRTIGEVATGLASWKHPPVPGPLYAEKPLLSLKAKALIEGRALAATAEHTGSQRHLTMAVPRHSEIELIFNAETDPTSEVVFGVALSLSVSVRDESPFAEVNRRWWVAWKQLPEGAPGELDLDPIIEVLDPDFLRESFGGDEIGRQRIEQQLRAFAEALSGLRAAYGVELDLQVEDSRPPVFYCRFAYINGGTELDDERKLAEVLVERAFAMVTIASTLESLIGVVQVPAEGKPYVLGPRFAGFYWSVEQLEHVQDLLERHLDALAWHPRLRSPLLQLINWLSPTESQVSSAHQHKKLFNLRTFIETSLGLPHIINYTWHRLAKEAFSTPVNARFWAPHFNYMDFAPWHAYVQERDSSARMLLHQELVEQLLLKVRAVHRLLWRYRGLGRETIAAFSTRPVSSETLLKSVPPSTLHPLARAWYLFSRLNGAMGELRADGARTTFPARSIGRLEAGEVSELELLHPDRFRFCLADVSANMKVKEGDQLLLLSDGERDLSGWTLRDRLIRIESMRWQSSSGAYRVEARGAERHPLFDGSAGLEGPWYLYPSASDSWSAKLFGNRGSLLDRQSLGRSWLGWRLSYLWRIGNEDGVPAPGSRFTLPEIYLYAPEILPRVPVPDDEPLRTDIHHPPDPSQQAGIRLVLSSTLCCLQGPPGTGKSQTIAALIDEILCRRGDRPTRVLVTAFSYAALSVVLDKVLESRNAAGEPTRAARTRAVFLRSESREPVDAVLRGQADDLVCTSSALIHNGKPLDRRKEGRLDEKLPDSMILFANAHQLYQLGKPSSSKKFDYEWLGNDFGFDLIIVDEASQMPVDQFLASVALVRPQPVPLVLDPDPLDWPARSIEALEGLRCASPLDPDTLTRLVIVGDDNQLPPVQAIKPPKKLRPVLDSLFRYYADGHKVPRHQLQVNYRSDPRIVDYTRRLGLYEGLRAFRQEQPYPPLPPVPASITEPWLQAVLDPDLVVGTILHDRRFETAVSPLEALLVARITVAFFEQMGIDSPEAETNFWREQMGIVSPHNAHGRLVARQILEALTTGPRRTRLSDEDLVRCLDATIYSVEKFQGSDRSFILATTGISSIDQLQAEEAFIYDLNRFNVLTSRAKQKMLLVCSQNLLRYVPRDREVMAHAARIRSYALEFCDREAGIAVVNEEGNEETLQLRWHGGEAPASATIPETGSAPPPPSICTLSVIGSP